MLSQFGTAGSVDEVCPPPDHPARKPATFTLPRGAVDAHAHVIGPPPYSASRSYTPGMHPKRDYFEMLDTVGFDYGVLIQTSVHGTDNAVMLDALESRPRALRGVAVVPHDIADAQLAELVQAGVRGLRLITAASGGIGMQHLDRYEAMCLEAGLHIQIMFDASKLGDDAKRLARLKVPLVIDHLGYFPASQGLDSPAMANMRLLLAEGAWVKLSGAFRIAPTPGEAIPVIRACVEAAPDRCVWGSDWPHVGFWGTMPNVGELLDLLAQAVEPAQRDRILTSNAHRLYGFAPEAAR